MELKNLKWHVRTLATLPETDAPVVSCYLALENGRIKKSNAYEEHVRPIKRGLLPQETRSLEDALEPIGAYLANDLLPDAKGIAIFSRAGSDPFFLPLQFRVPLPNWIVMDSTPNIYHLVELKDTYHRYVVLITTHENARILEVNLGSVTQELWIQRPELRKRIGREWTKIHFQKHARERGRRFIKEKVQILDRLMSEAGHTHLVLAGHPSMTAQVRDELPKHLLSKLIELVPVSSKAKTSKVVEATIASFIKAEEKESQDVAELLSRNIHTGGLAVTEVVDCLIALRRNQVDTLVLLKTFSPGLGWACTACEFIDSEHDRPEACPACGESKLKEFDIKEEMVRLAERAGATVETVNKSDTLSRLGAVGCLLRYRLPEEYA